MAGFDGTGPQGNGPIGRGMGPCGRGMSTEWRQGFRVGMRFGRRGSLPTFAPGEEKEFLVHKKRWLETQLAGVEQRLQGIQEARPNQ